MERHLDYIYLSGGLCTSGFHTEVRRTHTHFTTDHFAVVSTIGISQILTEQTLTIRRQRSRKIHKDQILDNKNNTEKYWKLYNECLLEDFKNLYHQNPYCTIDFAYNKIADQLGKIARSTLRWKKTCSGTQMKYTKTEVLIHKARRLVYTYNQQFLQQDSISNQ